MKTFMLAMLLGLTGFVTTKDILSIPEFRERYESVKIDTAQLEGVSGKGISVIAVFGDWCSDSVEHVPEFIRIDESTHFDAIEWVAVGRHLADDTGIVETFHIQRVPTFIFMKDGKEIGRIVEHPKKTIVIDTAGILKAGTSK